MTTHHPPTIVSHHFDSVLKDQEGPTVVEGEIEATFHADPHNATKDGADDVGQVNSHAVEDSLHLNMEAQVTSQNFGEPNDPKLESYIIHLSDQEVATKFQMLSPCADFIIGSSMVIPKFVQVLEPLMPYNTSLHHREIFIGKSFCVDLVFACHK